METKEQTTEQLVKEDIREEIWKFLELDENENTVH